MSSETVWLLPPAIKVYEALGAVADGRVQVSGNTGRVTSSTGNKTYTVTYDPETNGIMANDNGSFWKGYLGYPAIAYLLQKGIIAYEERLGNLLKGIPWKVINQKFDNDFEKTLKFILIDISVREREELADYVAWILSGLDHFQFTVLGSKVRPPEGF